MGGLGHPLVARQDELAEIVRADERSGAEAHVVGAPDHLHAVELEHLADGHFVKLDQAPADGRHQVPLVIEGVAERLVAHQPGEILGKMGEAAAADDAHVVGQALLEPLQAPGGELFRIGPREGMELGPVGDRAAMLVDELAPAVPSQPGRVVRREPVDLHADVVHAPADVVVAQEPLHADLELVGVEGVVRVDVLHEAEPPGDLGLDLLVDQKLDEIDPLRRPLAVDAAEEAFPIGPDLSGKRCLYAHR